jgi:hypothetical protein
VWTFKYLAVVSGWLTYCAVCNILKNDDLHEKYCPDFPKCSYDKGNLNLQFVPTGMQPPEERLPKKKQRSTYSEGQTASRALAERGETSGGNFNVSGSERGEIP